MSSQTVRLFEDLAEATWDRIKIGHQYQISQGEETITDINLLEFKRAGIPDVRLYKLSKAEESQKGLDWEWWIGSGTRWWRYAVQAKKLTQSDSEKERYASLNHKVNGRLQIDILEEYARSKKAIPIYCLYNHINRPDLSKFWHCDVAYTHKQLGCTVVSVDVIKKVLPQRGKKTFEAVHEGPAALPWRCLVGCSHILNMKAGEPHPLAGNEYETYGLQPLPELYQRKDLEELPQVTGKDLSNLLSEYYNVRKNKKI